MPGQQTRQWILSNPPKADPVLEGSDPTFSLQNTTLPTLGSDQVLVKTLYISNDPAQRGWIQLGVDPERLYVPPVQKGDVMRAFAVAEVVESNADSLKKGQLVIGSLGWTEYAVVGAKEVRPVQADESAGMRPTHFLGSLGATGLTAYYGLVDVAQATADDVVVVSGAAGATGNMVVQIAKHLVGCKRVIGIAGGEKKCKWVESLGADVCVDYKSPTFKEDLKKATEGFVDVYFDNVGGEILELMLARIKKHGRVAACGSISTYNSDGGNGIRNWFEIIANRIQVRGFIVIDAFESGKAGPFIQTLVQGVKDGKIKIGPESETLVPTSFEDVPKTWTMLFSGGNTGKLITELKA
ncbi:NAD(P)-binding protein [Dothidotthia symphoricarpi CBS 119687]|uniref:NAD(P)-binding protein n=1 Tax=Dothidotthia symphoricarpi CBS 119687 TaxID=1392245 RepID=A0A6A6A2R5_9PLEO|nr:NAD(P)-binding protein [Dothidotthia symphoricarpi CBS 119687]KAF2126149.1 NAD(P)-binding protein [Dothidotthia symphoricarpi CBS 119687]